MNHNNLTCFRIAFWWQHHQCDVYWLTTLFLYTMSHCFAIEVIFIHLPLVNCIIALNVFCTCVFAWFLVSLCSMFLLTCTFAITCVRVFVCFIVFSLYDVVFKSMLHVLLCPCPLWCYTHNVEFAINALILPFLPLHSLTSLTSCSLPPPQQHYFVTNPYSDEASSNPWPETMSKLQSIVASRHEVVNDVHCSNHKEECKNFNCAIV